MTAISRGHARALSAAVCYGIGAWEQTRQTTLDDAIAEARCKAQRHHCPAYVYRVNGCFVASTNEPAIMPGAEFIREVAS
jgi:hypothetical protein